MITRQIEGRRRIIFLREERTSLTPKGRQVAEIEKILEA